MGTVTQKNFVTANAIENILAKPKVHDTSERLYILKPDFGEVPAYLQRNREQIQQERQQVQEFIMRQTNQVPSRPYLPLFAYQDLQSLVADGWEKLPQVRHQENAIDLYIKQRVLLSSCALIV